MEFRNAMESLAEAWMAAATVNGNLFSVPNGVQGHPLPLTTQPVGSPQRSTPSDSSSGKTLTIRCVIESIPSVQCMDNSLYSNFSSGHIEVDKKANIPIHTVCQNLVDALLHFFGYPKEATAAAKGSILIENWKPIGLEKVAENPQKTVYDVFGQISSFITVRIQILRTTNNDNNSILCQMKEKLLQLLILQNKDHILSSGCPLDQVTLKSMLRGSNYSCPSEEICRKFEQWIAVQYRQSLRPIPYPSPLSHFPFHIASSGPIHHDKGALCSPEDRMHPALQTVQSQYPTQKTRMRTSFDPELELPKLQKWFSSNQHPSRQQIQQYVNELNNLESRKGRKPLDINNVVYWFKNARAAQKRAEIRNLAPGLLNSLNGYRSNSQSPCETAMSGQSIREEDESNDESLDEMDHQPTSPVAPLSLITHKNNPASVDEIKQEPPDKNEELPPENNEKCKIERKDYSASHQDFESDEDDDISECGSTKGETKGLSAFATSSPLSIIPRPSSVSSTPNFPLVSNSMFNQSLMYMTQYIPSLNMNRSPLSAQVANQAYSDDRRKRNRTFIDPVTEVPCLERWFCMNTHPSHGLILQYTEDLNSMPYRQKFPRLEPKNVQFWFKNRRAKCKRLKSSLYDNIGSNNLSPQEQYHQLAAALSAEQYCHQD